MKAGDFEKGLLIIFLTIWGIWPSRGLRGLEDERVGAEIYQRGTEKKSQSLIKSKKKWKT